MLSKRSFIHQIFTPEVQNWYRRDNDWLMRWDEKWSDEVVMTRFCNAAYNLYKATATSALNLTLLGGTEIRLDQDYVRSFGVTAANGIQDKITEDIVKKEILERHLRARHPSPHARSHVAVATSVTGGAILSEKDWTPILNDALILGAITAGQEFHLALTPGEQADWNAMNGAKVNKTAVLASRFGETTSLVNAWKAFLNSQKRMFFFPWGGPRVFTREILGLSFFGYKPQFTWHQLSFAPGSGPGEIADFRNYLRKLNEVHFQAPTDQAKVMEAISKYLFNDPRAIGNPWPANTKTVV